ncbi:MAG: SIR2 family protein [Xenococcaceae cyanobacterium MO_207.B15]|nr:SIR2 family protein [Xenococcaceae cyanobacterium MO_207.B15]
MIDEDRIAKGTRIYWRKRLQLENNEFYEILVTQLPDAAAVDAALAVNDTIHEWKPEAVLMVGIAGAAKEGVQLGDLVLGREVCYYGRGKETVDGTLPEPKYYSADATLWGRVMALLPWDLPILFERPDGKKDVKPKTHCGVIASGERVITSGDIRDEIAANNRKIAAIEMEGYGVSAATFKQYRPVRCLVIRAISDLADASKNDRWQPYAAAVAAEFTKYFLLDKPLEPLNRPTPKPLQLPTHYKQVETAITQGQLIPFLGEGINLCDRPPANSEWQPGLYPPSDNELAEYLAKYLAEKLDEPLLTESRYKCPRYDELLKKQLAGKLGSDEAFTCPLFANQKLVRERKDLPYLAKYIDLIFGSLGLYTELHEIFDRDYQPNQLHKLFAQLPSIMQQKDYPLPYQLIVTTNYDDTLERAFKAIKPRQLFDIVSYIAKGENRGKFLHQPCAGKPIVIDTPNTYDEFPLGEHPVILKLYGAVNRATGQEDNFAITEDHYMDYLEKVNIPINLVDLMRKNHILFLDFDLSKWKNRLIFRRIWQDRPLDKGKSWVFRKNLGKLEKQIWQKSQVDMIDIPSQRSLRDYIAGLNKLVQNIPQKGQTISQ